MYYVNVEQIERRLSYMDRLANEAAAVRAAGGPADTVARLAAERAVHLAAECVTDVGHALIDGFVMRDASSYEDIVVILHGEKVFGDNELNLLEDLVRLRKPLVQEYDTVEAEAVFRQLEMLPAMLKQFAEAVRTFMKKELNGV